MVDSDILKILKYVEKCQQRDGSFLSYSNNTYGTKTTFYTSLILCSLKHIQHPISLGIRKKGIKFLEREATHHSSYNYMARDTKKYTLYPNDLDDTFLAFRAQNDSFSASQEILRKSLSLLIANETKPGGPYYTWLVSSKQRPAWNDIDVVVNSNIATYLQLHDITLPPLSKYFDSVIKNQAFTSLYYHSPVAIIYFISLHYRGKYVDNLKANVLTKCVHEIWNNPLETALAISALINLGIKPSKLKRSIEYLRATVHKNNFKPHYLFIEQQDETSITYSGCGAYTAASILEALVCSQGPAHKLPPQKYIDPCIRYAKNLFKTCDPVIKEQLSKSIDKVLEHNTSHEITYTPSVFLDFQKTLSHQDIVPLQAASLLGWIGYTICDDIIDGEDKSILLPLATICIREVSVIYSTYTSTAQYFHIKKILDGMSNALIWERTACKVSIHDHIATLPNELPNFGNLHILAEKSLGHALSGMCIFFKTGNTKAVTLIELFFRHYLIAKQLHDDAHDWYEDMQNGCLNYVAVCIIKKMKESKTIHLKRQEKHMRLLFWNHVVDDVSNTIIRHAKKAQKILEKIGFTNDSYFHQKLFSLRDSATRTLIERDEMRKIAKTFIR